MVDEGRIVEEGDHESLLAKGGIYAGLYKSQETEEEDNEKDNNEIGNESNTEEKEKEGKKKKENTNEDVAAGVSSDNTKSEEEKRGKDKPKKYSLFDLYQYFGNTKCIFWIAFIGVIFTALYPAGYAVVVSLMHSIPFRMDISSIWNEGIFYSTMMVVVTIIYSSGDILWWDLSSIVKENMIVTLRSKSFTKLLSQSVSYYDEKEHQVNCFYFYLVDSCNHFGALY